jgi:DNA invertase Pin-like site-specific DNA recombinase
MKTIAYVRVSKDAQAVKNQRLAILEFARQENLEISELMEVSVSSRRSPKVRQIDRLLSKLEAGDTLVVSELSRMGRSVGEIILTVDQLAGELFSGSRPTEGHGRRRFRNRCRKQRRTSAMPCRVVGS